MRTLTREIRIEGVKGFVRNYALDKPMRLCLMFTHGKR